MPLKQIFILLFLIFSPKNVFSKICDSCMDERDFRTKYDLMNYDFIAWVKIKNVEEDKNNKEIYWVEIEIIEKFKGKNIDKIYWIKHNAGVNKNQEWFVFATKNKIGFGTDNSCTKTFCYKNALGEIDTSIFIHWDIFQKFEKIFEVYGKKMSEMLPKNNIKNGTFRSYYPNNQIAWQADYKNGVLNGKKIHFSQKGDTLIYQNFENGKLHHLSKYYYGWHLPKVARTDFFENGKLKKRFSFDFEGVMKPEIIRIYHKKNHFLDSVFYNGKFLRMVEKNYKTLNEKHIYFFEKSDKIKYISFYTPFFQYHKEWNYEENLIVHEYRKIHYKNNLTHIHTYTPDHKLKSIWVHETVYFFKVKKDVEYNPKTQEITRFQTW